MKRLIATALAPWAGAALAVALAALERVDQPFLALQDVCDVLERAGKQRVTFLLQEAGKGIE